MSFRLALLLLAPWLLWIVALGALAFGFPSRQVQRTGDLAAGATVAAHLGVAVWLWLTRLGPTSDSAPTWAEVQAEKHRRKGFWLAGWGVAAGLGWLLVRPGLVPGGSIGWPVWFVVAGSLGFQPGLLIAEAVVCTARVRLGRLFTVAEGIEPVVRQGL